MTGSEAKKTSWNNNSCGLKLTEKKFSDVRVHYNYKVVTKTFFECSCQRGKQDFFFFFS